MEKIIKFPKLVGEMAQRGITQEALGEAIGLTRTTINKKLLGKTEWTIEEVEKVCDYFGKDYYELFK